MGAVGIGSATAKLGEAEVRELLARELGKAKLAGKKVLVIIPDSTRSAPVGMFFRLIAELIGGEAKKLGFLIALGTHPPMSEPAILRLLGITEEERRGRYGKVGIFNHRWDLGDTLTTLGVITADEIEEITGGLMREEVPVQLNRMVLEYEQVIICGPTFPHEVVGYSGGNKYLFPGIAGPEIINMFHWLGAVITNPVINGTKRTPCRDVVDRAAAMLKVPKLCVSMVVYFSELRGVYVGTPEEAYERAADLSAQIHVKYEETAFRQVLSCAPAMYDDIWTAGKCMYKLEPVLADGAELIIYAPHVTEISYTHGKVLDKIGYHVRDYFVSQMEKFEGVPRGVMAHSTHVKGIGTYRDGVERPRARVVLATGIPEARCRKVNLGYRDPAGINVKEFEGREGEGVLCVKKAGEILYRLKDGSVPSAVSKKVV